MSLLSRYLLLHYGKVFSNLTGIIAVLVLILDAIGNVRRFSYRPTFVADDMILLILYRIPEFISLLLPYMALLATLMTLSRLTSQNEITVMRASGTSLFQIVVPFLCAGLILSLGQMILQNYIVPHTSQQVQQLKDRLMNNPPLIPNKRLWLQNGRQIIQAESLLLGDLRLLTEVMVDQFDENHHLISRLQAKRAQHQNGQWWLFDGIVFQFGKELQIKRFKSQLWPIELKKEYWQQAPSNPEWLSMNSLGIEAKRLEKMGLNSVPYQIYQHDRIAAPFAILTAILLAAPFGFSLYRLTGSNRSILVGLLLGFALFVINSLYIALGLGGRLSPLLAVWIPVTLFATLGLLLLVKAEEPPKGR